MAQDPPGWQRYTSRRDGALFLHNSSTGESVWFEGWIQQRSKMYGRTYWFQPTTGRSEWELPTEAPSVPSLLSRQKAPDAPVADLEKPSADKVKAWMAKIKASKQAAGDVADSGSRGGGQERGHGGRARALSSPAKAHKRRRDEEHAEKAGDRSDDDMEVDDDDAEMDPPPPPPLPPPPLPPGPGSPLPGRQHRSAEAPAYTTSSLPPPREDAPLVSLRRETLRRECLERFAKENAEYGPMTGYSKTSRSCRDEGMVVGLSGMFGRFLWVQHMRQTLALASGEVRRASKSPPDPVFASVTDIDNRLVKELIEGGRSKAQAVRVLEELADSCRLASAELEALLETQLPKLKEQVVTLHEEITTPQGDTRLRPVTGKGARVLGPNPNSSYALRYVPAGDSGERETNFAITGAHLDKTWRAYCDVTQGGPLPVWDPDFLRRLYCVISRYETLSATSDGYQMAFPTAGFRLLRELVQVECECFASPLNCTLRRFCSVAYDTDKFFGSEGNFFLSSYQAGSFEANPPFVEEVMERMVDHMHHLLERAVGPMSFAIIVPGWDDTESYRKMVRSVFTRPEPGFHLILKKGEHNYRPGMQHRHDVEEKPSNCNTFLFILQNDQGAGRWPVTTAALSNLQTQLRMDCHAQAERNLPLR